jgi:head-tail adaptor
MANDLPSIGDLNRRVILQRVAGGRNTIGERSDTFNEIAPVWAKREDTSGGEGLDDGTVIALQVRRYFIRYRKAVYQDSANLIVVDDGVKWDVNYVGVHGRDVFIELKCSRRE